MSSNFSNVLPKSRCLGRCAYGLSSSPAKGTGSNPKSVLPSMSTVSVTALLTLRSEGPAVGISSWRQKAET
eukprot:s5848_g1.t1